MKPVKKSYWCYNVHQNEKFEFADDFSTDSPQKNESEAEHQLGFMMAANLKLFCIHLNKPHWSHFNVKILLNYQLKNEVSKANFNMYKRNYN